MAGIYEGVLKGSVIQRWPKTTNKNNYFPSFKMTRKHRRWCFLSHISFIIYLSLYCIRLSINYFVLIINYWAKCSIPFESILWKSDPPRSRVAVAAFGSRDLYQRWWKRGACRIVLFCFIVILKASAMCVGVTLTQTRPDRADTRWELRGGGGEACLNPFWSRLDKCQTYKKWARKIKRGKG